ncbi:DNA repair protein rad52 [Coniosporium tulheliwenetii]|uniref:DNA repair protein rad52 n=1 Tax=Coniosporium tulheliwenetii TaxID=3383036 RepID=A0ACC2Z9X0_9PEZI|nr:DNA repair protein rad52 [Cladosporium sp. JES 115]
MPQTQERTAPESGTLQSQLGKQLEPEYIFTSPSAGGGKEHNLAGEKVILLANEVFGFNGWSSAIRNIQIDFVDENQSTGQITLGLSIIVRVTLRDGTFHDDIGYGHVENCNGRAAAFGKAKKEAVTDALKRALRHFGNVFGNCFDNREYLSKVTKVKVAPKEAIADALSGEKPRATRFVKKKSYVSDKTELEDEFGGNPFYEVDFGEEHPDEVALDYASVTEAVADASEMWPNDQPPHSVLPPQSR